MKSFIEQKRQNADSRKTQYLFYINWHLAVRQNDFGTMVSSNERNVKSMVLEQ